jgi:hypothetical protein
MSMHDVANLPFLLGQHPMYHPMLAVFVDTGAAGLDLTYGAASKYIESGVTNVHQPFYYV